MHAPPALAFSTDNCTIGRAMEILGERWTFVVLREVFNGIRRFDDIAAAHRHPPAGAANRLTLLVEQGVLRREAYREPGQRERHEYRLTEKGFALGPVLVAIAGWGDRYPVDLDGPPIEFVHRDCGSLGAPAPLRRGARARVHPGRDLPDRPGARRASARTA